MDSVSFLPQVNGAALTAKAFTVLSDSLLQVVTPNAKKALPRGETALYTDVRVSVGQVQSAKTPALDHFIFGSVPKVTSVSPSSGPVAGGTPITIQGTGFMGATSIAFIPLGGGAGIAVDIPASTSDTTISVSTPDLNSYPEFVALVQKSGKLSLDVSVTTSGGAHSEFSAKDHFTYLGSKTG